MPMMPASSSLQAVGSQTTLPLGHPPTLRIAPPWGKGDPPNSVTGMLPRLLKKTRAGGNTWQHMCSIKSPEFKDALLITRAKKGSECTPEEHMIISHALKHEKAQARASKPTFFVILQGIAKELTSMMQTWLMNKAACPLSGDEFFSTLKPSWSFANSDLRRLWHSLDSNRLPVPETLQSTSYPKSLPAVPNTTARSFHSDPLPSAPSEGHSETATSSKGNLETSSDSTPSDPYSAPTSFGNSPSHSRDRVAPVASNIKGHIIKVIWNIKGQGWSGSVGNARKWPWS